MRASAVLAVSCGLSVSSCLEWSHCPKNPLTNRQQGTITAIFLEEKLVCEGGDFTESHAVQVNKRLQEVIELDDCEEIVYADGSFVEKCCQTGLFYTGRWICEPVSRYRHALTGERFKLHFDAEFCDSDGVCWHNLHDLVTELPARSVRLIFYPKNRLECAAR
jgi:hypothetical protein